MIPLQARVTVIALYAVFLASIAGVSLNVARDYLAGNIVVFAAQVVFLGLIVSGLVTFLMVRSLPVTRALYSAGIIVLIGGLIYTGGGTRGFGLLYIIAGFAALYFILGFRLSLLIPLIVLVGFIIRIPLGSFNSESFLNNPDLVTSYSFVIVISTILGIATIFFQHTLLSHMYTIAYTDEITSLGNRKRYEILGRNLIAANKQQAAHPGFSIIGVKVLHFSRINSFRGTQTGDMVLKHLALHLRETDPLSCTAFRYSGTVFFVLCRTTDVSTLELLAADVLKFSRKPIVLDQGSVSLELIMTITRFPEDAATIEDLTANVLTSFSRYGKNVNSISFFDRSIHRSEAQKYAVIEQLHHALKNDEFQLVFHPKINIETGRAHGAEILLRWNNAMLGRVEPSLFIPIAEEIGIINEITEWITHEAIAAIERIIEQFHADAANLVHAINLSVLSLSDQRFAHALTSLLEEVAVDPRTIEFEITESVMLSDDPAIQSTLHFLTGRGFRIAIDDFGTGYSSLSYLHKLHAHNLKIDREFIGQIRSSEDRIPIVDAIISMAQSMMMEITAEGVEYEYQEAYLRDRNCTLAQGWLYAKPLTLDDYISWLGTHVVP